MWDPYIPTTLCLLSSSMRPAHASQSPIRIFMDDVPSSPNTWQETMRRRYSFNQVSQIHGRKLKYVANHRPPNLWIPRPDLKSPVERAIPTGEAYTPSRFLQKILDSVHHNMMFQGPWQSSYLPNPQGLLTASAHSVHAAYSGKQCAERLFHFLIPQARA